MPPPDSGKAALTPDQIKGLAAADRSDLISTLVLLDPVVLSGAHGVVWSWMRPSLIWEECPC